MKKFVLLSLKLRANRQNLQGGPQDGLHRNLTMVLPLPFRRGEGRGEGSRCAGYPTVPSVTSKRRDSLRFVESSMHVATVLCASALRLARIRLRLRCAGLLAVACLFVVDLKAAERFADRFVWIFGWGLGQDTDVPETSRIPEPSGQHPPQP